MVEAQDIQEESTIIDIVFPSDFKIRINSLEGINSVIPFENYPFLQFLIIDNYGGSYKAIYNPIDHTKNINVKTDGTYLYVIVENYKLRGALKIKIGIAGTDSDFFDGKWNWYDSAKSLNVNIVL